MPNGVLTEPRNVARKHNRKDAHDEKPPSDPAIHPFGRIELQAPPEWIAELDRVAALVGISRSAYIRQACNLKMAADRKALEE